MPKTCFEDLMAHDSLKYSFVPLLNTSSRARGGGGAGGASAPPPPPTFLEILKSYWEKGVFSPPTLSHYSAPPPPSFKVAPRALSSNVLQQNWSIICWRISTETQFDFISLMACRHNWRFQRFPSVAPVESRHHFKLIPLGALVLKDQSSLLVTDTVSS